MLALFVITHTASRLCSEEAVRPVKLLFIGIKILSTIYPAIKEVITKGISRTFSLCEVLNTNTLFTLAPPYILLKIVKALTWGFLAESVPIV